MSMAATSTGLTQGINPETQVVRVVNKMSTPFKGTFLNQDYILEPERATLVPYLAMCLWLGHPDAVDMPNDPKKEKQYRHDEFERLRTRYGAFDKLEDWWTAKPSIEVYDIVTDTRLVTVVDDYEGDHLKPADGGTVLERQAMEQAMITMQEQMAKLQAELVRMQRGEAAVDASDIGVTDDKTVSPEAEPSSEPEVTTDTPRKVIVG